MGKKIIIIGAGIGGLSTGCYAQMNGYDTEIFEMHNISGGLCTSWKRKGYTIDGSLSFVTGTNRDTNFYRMWSELGATKNVKFINHDEIIRMNKEGKEFILYSDIDKLEKHMLNIAPEDETLIKEFIGDARKLREFNPPIDKFTFRERLKMVSGIMPYVSIFGKYKISAGEYASRFKNEFLREALTLIYSPDFPAIVIVMSIANYSKNNSGFPAGGSLAFVNTIEKRYLGLGGRINFRAKVESIIIKNNKAVGVRLADGKEHYADIVVSAADGYETLFRFLDGKYVDEETRKVYSSNKPFTPCIKVYLGVNKDFSNYSHTQIFKLHEKIRIADQDREYLSVQHYCYDKTLCAEGKSIVKVSFSTSYEYWSELYKNKELYKSEKEVVASIVLEELEKRFEGIKERIEMIDVTTPMTYERYSGSWQGSYMGWEVTPKTMSMKLSKKFKGLDNFYMAGQWLEGLGGTPPAAMSGRDVVKLICREDKREFMTSVG